MLASHQGRAISWPRRAHKPHWGLKPKVLTDLALGHHPPASTGQRVPVASFPGFRSHPSEPCGDKPNSPWGGELTESMVFTLQEVFHF